MEENIADMIFHFQSSELSHHHLHYLCVLSISAAIHKKHFICYQAKQENNCLALEREGTRCFTTRREGQRCVLSSSTLVMQECLPLKCMKVLSAFWNFQCCWRTHPEAGQWGRLFLPFLLCSNPKNFHRPLQATLSGVFLNQCLYDRNSSKGIFSCCN